LYLAEKREEAASAVEAENAEQKKLHENDK
jgi:hypothetical protein